MDRRHYLALVGSGLTLSIAGCTGDGDNGSGDNGGDDEADDSSGGDGGDTGTDDSSGGDGGDTGTDDSSGGENGDDSSTDDGGENGPENGGTPPEWTNWLAADAITSGGEIHITRIDLQRVRDHLPDFYADTGMEQLASTFGVAEESLDELINVEKDNTTIETVITGGFSEDPILSAVAGSPDEYEQYSGFNIIRESNTRDLGVADGTILLSNSVQGTIDANRGEKQRVTAADADWNTMLSSLGNSPLAFVENVIPRDSGLTAAPELITRSFTNFRDVWVDATHRYQYRGEEKAATAMDSDEDYLVGQMAAGRGVMQEMNQQGTLVVVEGEVPSETLSYSSSV